MSLLKRRREAAPPPSFASRCTEVRTPEGRKAHLRHPEMGVLCGWPGADVPAAGLQRCRMCADALAAIEAAVTP